jgi:hypothetical protein
MDALRQRFEKKRPIEGAQITPDPVPSVSVDLWVWEVDRRLAAKLPDLPTRGTPGVVLVGD